MSHNMYTKIQNRKMGENEINEFINVSREVLGEENIQTIILFGSKAAGTDTLWSDYDFYVVTRKEFGRNEKFKIYERLTFNADIIFRTYLETKAGIHSFCSIDIHTLYYGEFVYGEELETDKREVLEFLRKKEIILRPELGKGVIEYGTRA